MKEKNSIPSFFVRLLLLNGRIYMDRRSKPTNIELLFEMGRKHRIVVYLLMGNPSIDGYSYNLQGITHIIIKHSKVRLVWDIEN